MELSLKLYQGYDLRLGNQQLIAEAPDIQSSNLAQESTRGHK
jgi:hypothetical protein